MKILIIGKGLIGTYLNNQIQTSEIISSSDSFKRLKLEKFDYVVNCSFDDGFFSSDFDINSSFDSKLIKAISRNTKYIMLSTRKVYQDNQQWNACEFMDINIKEINSIYGRNKYLAETFLKENLSEENYLLLRLPNIIGLRPNKSSTKQNFFDQMYKSLLSNKCIYFDFNRHTKKDFMLAEDLAKVIKLCINAKIKGIYNCGYGYPLECIKLAEVLMNHMGYGEIKDEKELRDEFFLNTSKLQSKIRYPKFKGLEKGIAEIIR